MAAAVLVTGAGGLVGQAVASRLVAAGRTVVAADRAPPADPLPFPLEIADVTDTQRLYGLIVRGGVRDVVHCGGISGPMQSRDNPAGVMAVNVAGTVGLLEAARVLGLGRIVVCSSSAAYGNTPPGLDPVDESAPLNPAEIYGVSKAATDMAVRAYAAEQGVDAVAMRIAWVYGPRRTTASFIRTMIVDAMVGRPTRQSWGGDYGFQFVHVDDVAAALIAALDAPALPSRAYNVTGGDVRTASEIGDMVRTLFPGADIACQPGPVPADYVQARFDIGRAARELGWRPARPFTAALADYAAWLAGHEY